MTLFDMQMCAFHIINYVTIDTRIPVQVNVFYLVGIVLIINFFFKFIIPQLSRLLSFILTLFIVLLFCMIIKRRLFSNTGFTRFASLSSLCSPMKLNKNI